MKFEWIKCKDRFPENPENPMEEKMYFVAYKNEATGHYLYSITGYADGWNCSLMFDGTISKEHEMKDIVAWAEIPEYKD